MRFQLALLVAHRQIHDRHFTADRMINRALGFHLHGYRRMDNWRIILALTPWMLAQLWFADTPPDIAIPNGWGAEQRADADYQSLGPGIDLPAKAGAGKAHLNYHRTLGHYLLQPIVLNMEPYGSAQEIFEAWRQVTRCQEKNIKQRQRECKPLAGIVTK
jgi:hypothetical protein